MNIEHIGNHFEWIKNTEARNHEREKIEEKTKERFES